MVKRTLLAQKLASYSVLATAILVAHKGAKAQILYTRVNDTIYPNNSYNLDLNGDGITDFVIKNNSFDYNTCSGILYGSCVNLDILPSSNNAVAGEPVAMYNSQQVIGYGDKFYAKDTGLLFYRQWGSDWLQTHFSSRGLWDSMGIDKFAGLRIKVNQNYYYGWVRLTILYDYEGLMRQYKIALKDYALMLKPNTPIDAGEENNGISADAEITNGLTVSPNPANKEVPLNISFNLNYANETVTIRAYDMMGRQVSNAIVPNCGLGLNTFQLPIANLAAGIYQVKISTNEFVATKEIVISK